MRGNSIYSPDLSKLICYNADNQYFIADADGTDVIDIGKAKNAQWVDNHRVLIENDFGFLIFDRYTRKTSTVPEEWRYVGQTPSGRMFMVKGNSLYQIINDSEEKILELPWRCDYLFAKSSEGPFIVVSNKNDAIYLVSENNNILIAKPSLFLNKMTALKLQNTENISYSPKNDKVAIFQNTDNLASVKIINLSDSSIESKVLNFSVSDISGDISFNMTWLDNNRLIINNTRRMWVVDMTSGAFIYELEDEEGTSVAGILR